MHEMSLCESILDVMKREAEKQSFARVKTIWLEIGPFAGVEPEALKFCFDAVMRGSLAEGARLEIVACAGQAYCFDCLATVALAERQAPCPHCGGHVLQVTGGDELRIKELEVD